MNSMTNVASALAALQSQLPLAPLLMPNHLGLGNLTGFSTTEMTALSQAFQQVQQASLQQQIQNYMELLHSGANSLGQQKNTNAANAQAQAAAQFLQVSLRINAKEVPYPQIDKAIPIKFIQCLTPLSNISLYAYSARALLLSYTFIARHMH